MSSPDLPFSTPGEQGVDARGIAAFLDALEADARIDPHSVMLLRHGAVVAQGWWAPYTPDRLHLLYSLSKTFTATALGFAVAEGLVGLDDAVVDHFPEFQAEITGRSRDILVRHVAAMASGHHNDMMEAAERTDPTNFVRGFLLHEPESAPGTVFAYNQPCTYSVAAIVQRAAGTTLVDYLRPRLLDPLGIGPVTWHQLPPGQDLGFSGLHAHTDAIARLGQLYLQDGVWHGRQLLPAGWAEQVRTLRVSTPDDGKPDWAQGYGFQVWMARHGYRGDGAYGQFCVILPEQDAVLAITSATTEMQVILDAAWEHLLPAFDATAAAPEEEEAALARRLSTLALPPLTGNPKPEPLGSQEPPGSQEPLGNHEPLGSHEPHGSDEPPTGQEPHGSDEQPDSRGQDGHAEPFGDPAEWVGDFTVEEPRAFGLAGTLEISRGAGGWHLVLPDGAAGIEVPFGVEGWCVSDFAGGTGEPGEHRTPVASSGGWTDEDTLRLDVLFLETPHRLELTIRRHGRRCATRWVTEPLLKNLSDLHAPRPLR